ncbi:phosphonate metabolism transcriptional regulator PhnF [Caenispirillum salinarum]|uniref:phosphonate metabolism transcriptional regulator PhnF n=1 Tax=Caenispirillum salinarum TaxID=859058 RepID=UPI0038515D29
MDDGLDRRRGAGVALWRQIQRVLESEIREGVFKPGERLPTEFELATRFSVNRHTVRRALAEMEEKGLLRVEQGRGTFVHEHVIDYAVGKRTRFSSNLSAQGLEAAHEFVRAEIVEAESAVAEALGVARKDKVMMVDSIGMADDRRISLSSQYLPARRFPDFDVGFRETGSVTETLKRYGVEDYTRAWTRVIARMPAGAEADLLHQPKSRPVLVTEALDVDGQGRPVSFNVTRFASDWVQLVIGP